MGEPAVRILESISTFTTLGIRFWDSATDIPVADNLIVTARRVDPGFRIVPAVRNASGIYVFHDLPGLRAVQYPSRRPERQQPLDFLITVEDRGNRFLPMIFGVQLPLPYRGIFPSGEMLSPPGGLARAYLFSAPHRMLPPTLAAVRADLHDIDQDRPAAHAVMQVEAGGRRYTGIADHNGRVLVAFPYPPADRLRTGSPPGSGQGPISEQSWPVHVRVRYGPDLLEPRFPEAGWPWTVTPSLKRILADQRPALIIAHESDAPRTEWTRELRFGQQLELRTAQLDPAASAAEVWITRGSSTP